MGGEGEAIPPFHSNTNKRNGELSLLTKQKERCLHRDLHVYANSTQVSHVYIPRRDNRCTSTTSNWRLTQGSLSPFPATLGKQSNLETDLRGKHDKMSRIYLYTQHLRREKTTTADIVHFRLLRPPTVVLHKHRSRLVCGLPMYGAWYTRTAVHPARSSLAPPHGQTKQSFTTPNVKCYGCTSTQVPT